MSVVIAAFEIGYRPVKGCSRAIVISGSTRGVSASVITVPIGTSVSADINACSENHVVKKASNFPPIEL